MSYLTENASTWLSVLFLIVIPIPIYLIAKLAKKGSSDRTKNRNFYAILGFYFLFLTYTTILCFKGLFQENALPPRILVLTSIPLLLFLLVLIFNTRAYKNIIRNISLSDLVRLHIFRLIGSFFLLLYFYEQLPKVFAFIAGIGDLTTAISSIFVAKAIKERKSFAKPLTYFWNTFGLLDILATSGTAFILTKLSIENGTKGVEILTEFPFCFIPAFAPATIIFLHISIYKKLLQKE